MQQPLMKPSVLKSSRPSSLSIKNTSTAMAPPTRRPGEMLTQIKSPASTMTTTSTKAPLVVNEAVSKVKMDFENRRRSSNELRGKISHLKIQITNVRRDISEHVTLLASLNAGMAFHQRQSEITIDEICMLDEELSYVRNNTENFRDRVEQLEKHVAEFEESLAMMINFSCNLQDLFRLASEKHSMKKQIFEVETEEIYKQLELIANGRLKEEEIKNSLSLCLSKTKRKQEEITSLDEEINQLSTRLREHRKQESEQQNEKIEATKLLERETLVTSNEKIGPLEQALLLAKSKRAELSESIDLNILVISQLRNSIQKLQEENQKLNFDIQVRLGKNNELKNRLDQELISLEECQLIAEDLSNTIGTLQHDACTEESNLVKLKEQLSKNLSEHLRTIKNIKDTTDDLDGIRNKEREEAFSLKLAELENRKLRNDYHRELNDANEIVDKKKEMILGLMEQLSNDEEVIVKKSKQYQDLQENIADNTAAKEELSTEFKAGQAKLHDLSVSRDVYLAQRQVLSVLVRDNEDFGCRVEAEKMILAHNKNELASLDNQILSLNESIGAYSPSSDIVLAAQAEVEVVNKRLLQESEQLQLKEIASLKESLQQLLAGSQKFSELEASRDLELKSLEDQREALTLTLSTLIESNTKQIEASIAKAPSVTFSSRADIHIKSNISDSDQSDAFFGTKKALVTKSPLTKSSSTKSAKNITTALTPKAKISNLSDTHLAANILKNLRKKESDDARKSWNSNSLQIVTNEQSSSLPLKVQPMTVSARQKKEQSRLEEDWFFEDTIDFFT